MNLPPLWEHQRIAIEKAKTQANLALFFEPGTGKSRTLIEILRNQSNSMKRIPRTLIVCPLVVCPQWKAEFARYSKIPPEKILVLNQAGPRRVRQFRAARKEHPTGFIAVTNYEALLTQELYSELLEWMPETVGLDESHRVKDNSSRRFKLLRPLCHLAKNRYLLTGTPVLNSPLDLFAPYLLMDDGATFGTNFYSYRAIYLYDKNAGMPKQNYFPKWIPRPNAAKALATLLERTAVQAKKDECLDLPELVKIEIPVELSSEQKKAYLEMKKTYITMVQNKVIAANLAITQTQKLQTILSGFLMNPDPEGKPILFKENPRLDALVDLVKDLSLSGKGIIWTNFVATYDLIFNALEKAGISAVFLTGRESGAEKEANIQAFCHGDAQICIANPQAVGLGVNLVEAHYSVYYSRSYSLEHAIQTEARNYRAGSEKHSKISHFHLVAKDTLDEVILKALNSKASLADAVMDWANLA